MGSLAKDPPPGMALLYIPAVIGHCLVGRGASAGSGRSGVLNEERGCGCWRGSPFWSSGGVNAVSAGVARRGPLSQSSFC